MKNNRIIEKITKTNIILTYSNSNSNRIIKRRVNALAKFNTQKTIGDTYKY